jgi:hypothetical protein
MRNDLDLGHMAAHHGIEGFQDLGFNGGGGKPLRSVALS